MADARPYQLVGAPGPGEVVAVFPQRVAGSNGVVLGFGTPPNEISAHLHRETARHLVHKLMEVLMSNWAPPET